MFRVLVCAAVLALSMSSLAHAEDDMVLKYEDEIKAKITEGWNNLAKRDLAKAAEVFGDISSTIRMIRAKQLDYLFPDAPDGWVKKQKQDEEYINEGAAGNMFGGMSMISAEYTDGAINIEVNITGDSPMMESLVAMARLSPEAAMKDKEKFKGGYLEFEESSYENQITIMLLETASTIQIQGKGMTKEQGMIFANLLDLDAVNNAFKKAKPD